MTIFCDKIIQPSPPTQLSGVSEPPFLPLHSLPLRLQLRSRSLRAQKAATLTLSIPSAFRHSPRRHHTSQPHKPRPGASLRKNARKPPARQAVRSLAPRAERPQPCDCPHSAGSAHGNRTADPPARRSGAASKRQSSRESQPYTSKPIKHHCIFPRRLYNTYPNRQSHISHKFFSLITQPFTTSAILEYFSVHQYFSKKDLVYNIN